MEQQRNEKLALSLTPIKFDNQQNPKASFDLIRLEELYQRKIIDHSPFELHRVAFYLIIFIENGQGFHTIDFTDYTCSKGTLLTIRKDQIQKFFRGGQMKGTLLLFTNDFLVSYLEKMEAQKTMLLFNEFLGVPKLQLAEEAFKQIQEIIKRMENEYLQVNDDHSLGIVRSELHILVTKLFRIKAENEQADFDKKYLEEFIAFQKVVEEKVTQTTKVQDFARILGVSTKTLNTITKGIVHKSAKEFVDEICIKQIKRLLINTRLSVKEVAYQSGFEETTNFYKYFKRHTQITPEQFRAAH